MLCKHCEFEKDKCVRCPRCGVRDREYEGLIMRPTKTPYPIKKEIPK